MLLKETKSANSASQKDNNTHRVQSGHVDKEVPVAYIRQQNPYAAMNHQPLSGFYERHTT